MILVESTQYEITSPVYRMPVTPILSVLGGHHEILDLPGKKGPGKGKTIVLVSGDEEHRTEESMPMLARSFPKARFFIAKFFLLGIRPAKHIDPNNQVGVRGVNPFEIGGSHGQPVPDSAVPLRRMPSSSLIF